MPCLQVPQRGAAWTCTERAPTAADGTISMALRLCAPTGHCCLLIRGLAAKPIRVDPASSQVTNVEAANRKQALYATEWQAMRTHALPHVAHRAVSNYRRQRSVFVLTPADGSAAMQYEMAASGLQAAGAALATSMAQTAMLQTIAARAGRSAAQLLTCGGQPGARVPAGCHISSGANASTFSTQAMLRVAAMELGSVECSCADVGLDYPEPVPRCVVAVRVHLN